MTMNSLRCAFAILLGVLVCACAPDTAEPLNPAVTTPQAAEVVPEVLRRQSGTMTFENVPEARAGLRERLVQYQNTRSATLVDWMPTGGGMLIATRFGDSTQLHLVTKPGGAREQITFFEDPVAEAWVRPQGAAPFGMIFAKDQGGSEFDQLFFFDWQARSWTLQTDGKSLHGGVKWSNLGDRFAYFGTARNGKDRDLYIGRIDGASELILEKEGAYSVLDWSPDDKRLLVQRFVSIAESYLYILDLDQRTLTPLLANTLPNPQGPNPQAGEANEQEKEADTTSEDAPTPATLAVASAPPRVYFDDAKFSRDGLGVYFTSDEASEYVRLHYLDLKSSTRRVLSGDLNWDVTSFTLSRDGKLYAFVVNEDGFDTLQLRSTQRDRAVALPAIPKGLIGGLAFSPEGDRLGLNLASARAPADVFSIEIKQRRLDRWTNSEVGGLQTANFVEAELIRYPSFDGRQIPAFVYRASNVGPHAVLIDIHGGPEAQARPGFSAMRQFYVADVGITVIEPNVRGSTGYGKAYAGLDNGMERDKAVRDIGALLDWIGTQGDLDPSRVAVIGASYGGYMTLASLAEYGDRLRAGVSMVGISHFVSFLQNTQPYRQDLRRQEYGDDRDPTIRAYLEGISPLARVDKLSRPMLIAQGLNDPRVPASESEQIVKALRKQKTPVWYMTAADEGHGFARKQNRDAFAAATVMFLEQYLLPSTLEVAPDGAAAPVVAGAPSAGTTNEQTLAPVVDASP